MSVPCVPALSAENIEAIRIREVAWPNLEKLTQWYFGFFEWNDHWIKAYDHNHLQITRVVKSLDLFLSQKAPIACQNSVLEILGDQNNPVSQDAIWFRKAAISQTSKIL